ncbi:hypothetical protein RA272_27990, partial [Pseudomonas syringae pv. tagetis]|uniref:hypothetical protein n=1 Tax=Pseudomonas syringae group genomosp. 7 TaxID=251699 RepID=UPI00376F7590
MSCVLVLGDLSLGWGVCFCLGVCVGCGGLGGCSVACGFWWLVAGLLGLWWVWGCGVCWRLAWGLACGWGSLVVLLFGGVVGFGGGLWLCLLVCGCWCVVALGVVLRLRG